MQSRIPCVLEGSRPFEHPLDREERVPRVCVWEITRACNLSCVHCDSHASRPSSRELSFERLKSVSDELAALGCRLVDLTGGEPLLRPDWDRLSQYLTSRSIQVALVTNGTLLSDEAVERAVGAGVSAISISIDGLRDTHDVTRRFAVGTGSAFDAALSGLKRARERLPVSVITQVNRTNLGELPAIGKLLGELGVARWQVQITIPTPRVMRHLIPYPIAPADLEALTSFIVAAARDPGIPRIHTSDTIGYATTAEAQLRQKASGPGMWLGCVAGIRAVAIKYDGTVRGCSLLPEEFNAGDLHTEALSAIWSDRERFAYTAAFEPSQLCGGCRRCDVGAICRAGCTTMAYFCTGTVGDNPYCLRRVRAEL